VTAIYKNPPLVYVKANIWWHVNEFSHFEYLKLLNGRVYESLKVEYPVVENGFSRNVEPLESIFSNEDKKLVLELSHGSASLISTDEKYSWDEFIQSIELTFGIISDVLVDLIKPNHLHGVLVYEDYFECSFDSFENVMSLANDLKLSFGNELFKNPESFRFAFMEKHDFGNITIDYKTINNKREKAGLYVNFHVDSETFGTNIKEISSWFNGAHDICSSYFDRMIEGKIKQQIT